MRHGLLLCPGGDDLLIAGGFGSFFTANLVGVRLQRGLLRLLFLELERVAHFFGFQFFGQQLFHACLVFLGQRDLANGDAAQRDAVRRQLGLEFRLDGLLDLGAPRRKDLAHRVAREYLVDHALHRRFDDGAVDIGRQRSGNGGHTVSVERVAHRQVHAERQSFHRLERLLIAAARAIYLVEQGELTQPVHARHQQYRPIAHHGHGTGELVGADAKAARRQLGQRRVRPQPIAGGAGQAECQQHRAVAAHAANCRYSTDGAAAQCVAYCLCHLLDPLEPLCHGIHLFVC